MIAQATHRLSGFQRPGFAGRLLGVLFVLLSAGVPLPRLSAAVKDVPFPQAESIMFRLHPELTNVGLRQVVVDSDGRVYVRTERGVARLFGDTLAADNTYRPLAGKLVRDLTLQHGELFYLLEDEFLSNGFAGRYVGALPKGEFRHFAVAPDFSAFLAGPADVALFTANGLQRIPFAVPRSEERVYCWDGRFYVLAADQIFRLGLVGMELLHRGEQLTALAFRDREIVVGTRRGFYTLDLQSGRQIQPLQDQLPATNITCLAATASGLWAGTSRGVFYRSTNGVFRYFASRRWLSDDEVVDLQPDARGDLYVLTAGGLTKIEFVPTTLAEKAAHYEHAIRDRHIRYGFCAELRLRTPGDLTSAEMIDTDNDGTWSSYYLASQAFHYAVTGEESARANAWQTFEALERLQTINNLDGFPARTFERSGYKVSDPDRWRVAPDPRWEWKGHTSSDEITAQTFALAVLYEVAARTPAERSRIAALYDRILAHLLRNNLYLVDVDGQPTLWGRWNPEYVNHYPPTIVDRRLNSAEIVAFLQFGARITSKPVYRTKGLELLNRDGYRANITNSLANIQPTPGFVFRGNDMGDEWNHSDDLLGFINDWTLYRYAFNEDLRRLYAAAVADHWNVERLEHNPLWSFILAMTGAPEFDLEGALWTLRRYPLDLITWTVQNSQRRDFVRLPANFRDQQTQQVLPPDERPTMRWNGNPFALDGGDGGQTELAGDEFLLPYWMGRYLRIIE